MRRLIRTVFTNDGLIVANNLISGPGIRNESENKVTFLNNLIKDHTNALVDPRRGDLHLTDAAIEAIDKGIALAEVVEDVDRQPRGGKPDIGADELTRQTTQEQKDLPDEPTSENDERLKRGLARYRGADANHDGVLTLTEVRAYMDGMRERGERRRSAGLPAELRKLYENRRYVSKDGERLRYDLMKPVDYDPGEEYPLVLCLHGSGGSTGAVPALAGPALRAKYRYFVLAPEALAGESWGRQSPQIMADIQPLVVELIETLQDEFSIDARRIYVTGQSMGGFGTYAFIQRNPDMFAAAVPVCGRSYPAEAHRVATMPIWIFHGDEDARVPVQFSRDMFAALKKTGGDPKYTEYKGVKHNSWDKAYATAELWEWLFAQKRKDKQK
jgi:poly(3-hydroxybutyrate) depolymerase